VRIGYDGLGRRIPVGIDIHGSRDATIRLRAVEDSVNDKLLVWTGANVGGMVVLGTVYTDISFVGYPLATFLPVTLLLLTIASQPPSGGDSFVLLRLPR
jgi:hypothetical protein